MCTVAKPFIPKRGARVSGAVTIFSTLTIFSTIFSTVTGFSIIFSTTVGGTTHLLPFGP